MYHLKNNKIKLQKVLPISPIALARLVSASSAPLHKLSSSAIMASSSTPFKLPADFLSSPGREKKVVSKVNFKEVGLPEYDGLYAVVIDNCLSKEECNELVRAAEAEAEATTGKKGEAVWEQALVNVGNGKQKLMTDVRDCGRIIWDDIDLVAKIWSRVKDCGGGILTDIDHVKNKPQVTGFGPMKRGHVLQMTRLNERMRFLRYEPGQYFRPHMDGAFFTPDKSERSVYTLHLYLNESDPTAPEGPIKGGSTTFHSLKSDEVEYNVEPKIGRVLIFQHRGLLHSGQEVFSGIKLTMRTDLMYKLVPDDYKK